MTLPYSNPTTSRAAAQSVPVDKVKADRKAITAYIAGQGAHGATDDELARALPQIHPNALRARRGECIDYGVITDLCGERRATATGAMAQVHHVTRLGLIRLGLPAADWAADKPVQAPLVSSVRP